MIYFQTDEHLLLDDTVQNICYTLVYNSCIGTAIHRDTISILCLEYNMYTISIMVPI